jgi:hypothetical protein
MRQAKFRKKHLADTAARDEFKADFLPWSELEQHGGVPAERETEERLAYEVRGHVLVRASVVLAHEAARA